MMPNGIPRGLRCSSSIPYTTTIIYELLGSSHVHAHPLGASAGAADMPFAQPPRRMTLHLRPFPVAPAAVSGARIPATQISAVVRMNITLALAGRQLATSSARAPPAIG